MIQKLLLSSPVSRKRHLALRAWMVLFRPTPYRNAVRWIRQQGNPPHNGRLMLAFCDDWRVTTQPVRARSINRVWSCNDASKYAFEKSDHGMFILLVFLLIGVIKSMLENLNAFLHFTSIKSGSCFRDNQFNAGEVGTEPPLVTGHQ